MRINRGLLYYLFFVEVMMILTKDKRMFDNHILFFYTLYFLDTVAYII